MREREGPRAQPVEHSEDGEAGPDGVSGLHRDEAGYPASAVRLDYL